MGSPEISLKQLSIARSSLKAQYRDRHLLAIAHDSKVKVNRIHSPRFRSIALKLVLYSKPGCHLCTGLQQKLEALSHLDFTLEVRDITTRDDWFSRYQYEIPVLCRVVETAAGVKETALPRQSPRASIARVEKMLQTYLELDTAK